MRWGSIVIMMQGTVELATAVSLSKPSNRPGRADHWAAWPTIALLMAALIIATLCGLPGVVSFILVPLTVLGAPLVGAGLLIIALVVALRRRPRMAASILIAAILPVLLWKPIIWTSECVHLALTVWAETGQSGRTSSSDDSSFAAYDWSIGFAGGPNTFLIHDLTDEIALPVKLHKHPIAAENGFGEDCAGNVTHLLGHYYICTF